jgi:hypothetical protein
MHRNEKRAQELHSDNDWVPTIPETMQLIFRWREYYAGQELRARDGQRPGDIFKSEKGPGVDPFALHFLMMACKARMVHRNGITFNGWHWYHEDLYGLKDYVLMFYSYYDLSQVYIFRMQQNGSPGNFLCTAKPIEKTKVFASDEFPEDVAAVQRVNSMKRKAINTTKRLADMLQSQKQVYIDWSRTLRDRPEVADAIKQIEDKSPKVVKISPFADEEQSQSSAPEEPVRYSKLSAPAFDHDFEYYDWYAAQDPKNLNDADRAWVADYMRTDQWEKFYGKKQATGGEG